MQQMTDAVGEGLIGRLVPITSAPGQMFAARPTSLDRRTAQMVAEKVRSAEPLAWLDALSDALANGMQQEGFHRTASTLFTSDLPIPPCTAEPTAPVEAECTGVGTAAAWKKTAAVMPDHAIERCRILARRAESRRNGPLSAV